VNGTSTVGTTDSRSARWGRIDEPDEAVARLLDAAGQVFLVKGVGAGSLADVAEAAGCARGTVYRYFGDRDGLRRAFVEREATRIGARVQAQVASHTDPKVRLVESVLVAVAEVRSDPVLAAWFTEAAAASTARVAVQTIGVSRQAERFLRGLPHDPSTAARLRPGLRPAVAAEAIVRVILSLLSLPIEAGSRAAASRAERELVTALLVPAIFGEDQPAR